MPDLTLIEYTSFVFSGGEIQVKITNPNSVAIADALRLTAYLTDSRSIFELALLTDAIRRINPSILLHLRCPYFPYARQDRVCDSGEALSLRVMADFINNLNFTSVTIWDAHSDVSLGLLNRVTNVGPENFLDSVLGDGKARAYVLVSPDAGAMKKVSKVAKKYNARMLTASKIRNPHNGEITGTDIHIPADLYHSKFLIVDDIVDGGRTFIELAKAITFEIQTFNPNQTINPNIELYVTHGIFSKGLDVILNSGISKIYTANPFPNVDTTNQNLTVLQV